MRSSLLEFLFRSQYRRISININNNSNRFLFFFYSDDYMYVCVRSYIIFWLSVLNIWTSYKEARTEYPKASVHIHKQTLSTQIINIWRKEISPPVCLWCNDCSSMRVITRSRADQAYSGRWQGDYSLYIIGNLSEINEVNGRADELLVGRESQVSVDQ